MAKGPTGKRCVCQKTKDVFSFAMFKLHVMTDQIILVEAEELWVFCSNSLCSCFVWLPLSQAIQLVIAQSYLIPMNHALGFLKLSLVRPIPWQEMY